MIRRLIGVLTVALIALLAFNWWNAEARATRAAQAPPSPFDWASVSSRDLNIAAVFLTARDVGVRQAMDSLQSLANADTTLRNDGHMIAHALGRFAVAGPRGNPAALSQCRPTFQAGCYHGVLEGYLSGLPRVDAAAATALCNGLLQPDSSRFPASECAHGLGHGFAEAMGYDLARALPACDAFTAGDLRSECLDGLFMENTVHGLGMPSMNVGDAATGAHMHTMAHATPTMTTFRASDLRFPCDSVAAPYQQSCWSYQPIVIARLTNYDFPKTLAACGEAPPASSANCYEGFGKQSMAWFSWSYPRVISTCEKAASHESDCLGGGVEALVDLTLSSERALTFCAATPSRARASCFARVGSRMARMHAKALDAERDCAAAAKAEFVDACVRGTHSQ